MDSEIISVPLPSSENLGSGPCYVYAILLDLCAILLDLKYPVRIDFVLDFPSFLTTNRTDRNYPLPMLDLGCILSVPLSRNSFRYHPYVPGN